MTRPLGVAAVLVALLALVGSLVTGTAPASAFWSSSGSAAATAATSTLSAPAGVTVPETATTDVPVSWTPGEGGVPPEGYYVVRDDGDTTAPACGSSPTSLLDGNDCLDEAVPGGEYTYVVNVVHGTWTAVGAPSTAVAVTAPAQVGPGQSAIRVTDALPPTVAIDGGPATTTKDTTPAVTGVSSAAPGSAVSVTVAGQNLSTTVTAGGTWTVTAAELTAGRYDTVARVRDANGDGAAAAQSLTVEVNPAPVDLGSAASFSVLAATAALSTGTTMMSGDLGVSPSTSVTGFPPGTYDGVLHVGDPAAATAQADVLAALDEAFSRAPHMEIAADLGGQVFHAGVHHQTAALAVTGTVTLDGEGDPGAVFIFVGDAALDTAAASDVSLINGAQPGNVFWVVAGDIRTGAGSSMSGTLLARGAITLGTGTALTGRALSRETVTVADSTLTGVIPDPPDAPEEAGPPATPDVPEERPDETTPSDEPVEPEPVPSDPADEATHDEATHDEATVTP